MTSTDDVMMMSSPDYSRQDDEGDVRVKMTRPSMNDNGIKGAVESQDDVICGGGDDVELRDDVMSNDTGISGHIVGDTDEVISRMSNNGRKDVVIPAPSMSSKRINKIMILSDVISTRIGDAQCMIVVLGRSKLLPKNGLKTRRRVSMVISIKK